MKTTIDNNEDDNDDDDDDNDDNDVELDGEVDFLRWWEDFISLNFFSCHGPTDGWTDGRKDGWTDGQTDGGTDGRKEPVAQRHQMVSNSLALLLFIGLDLPLGNEAAAPIGDKL